MTGSKEIVVAEMEMATSDEIQVTPKSKSLLVIGAILAVFSGAGGFYAVSAGLVPLDLFTRKADPESPPVATRHVFLAIDPMLVPLGNLLSNRHLRFRAQLEIMPGEEAIVQDLMPRIVDVLHGYLRALDRADLEQPSALIPLRSNMLRRVQTVVGPGRVRDLLIMEFVVN